MNTNQAHRNHKVTTCIQRALILGCLLVAPLLLPACKSKATAADKVDPSGEYALVSVDGKPVPAGVSHDGAKLEVRSGTFSIKSDGSCSTKTVFVPPSGQEVSKVSNATYTLDGPKLTMKWQGAGTTIGTVEGNTFTMNNEGMILVYQK